MSESIKAIIKANSTKVKVVKVLVETLSLRRDRHDSKPSVMSEFEVTPQFVWTKLDDFLGKHIKDVEIVEVAAVDETTFPREKTIQILKSWCVCHLQAVHSIPFFLTLTTMKGRIIPTVLHRKVQMMKMS